MTWSSLKDRFQQLPLVLAGPILRRTEPNQVTVWIALKEKRTVTLEILNSQGRKLFHGSHQTLQLGTNLHIVAVTAYSMVNLLNDHETYFYNLDFGYGQKLSHPGIITATGELSPITYPQYQLPSFCLPPANISQLRLLHGSCRKPHGESLDALATVDKMIAEALINNPEKRPHQLFLTGDQIYADDVADGLLFMLMDAVPTLLGWSEKLPDVDNNLELNPGRRNRLATKVAGLTASLTKTNQVGNVAKSHLMTFSDFCLMYLFAWSDLLWVKPEDFPDFCEVFSDEHRLQLSDRELLQKAACYRAELCDLKDFHLTLPQVRRALANIPTYMIFDDHEITDDWYLNMAWCDRVLSKPLGRRVLQNGLLAYAICQGWGNTPHEFRHPQPGGVLLQAAQGWFASGGTNSHLEQEISRRIGLPTVADIRNNHPRRLSHSHGSVTWHYTVITPSYEVLVLDTRTCRDFPGKEFDFPGLLSAEACQEQIPPLSPQNHHKLTLVISPGPVIGVPFVETLQVVAKNVAEKLGSAAWGFDPEAWKLEPNAFERLLSRLATRNLPNQQSRVILLSGDVHYGFAARLQYGANHSYEYPEKISTELIAVQFTSSSFKNEVSSAGGSRSLHQKGFIPTEAINHLPSAEVLGWANPSGKELLVGEIHTMMSGVLYSLPWRIKNNPAIIDLVAERSIFRGLQITRHPEWWYRADFILAKHEAIAPPHKPSLQNNLSNSVPLFAPLPQQERIFPLEQYLQLAKQRHKYLGEWGMGKEIVGVNNIGEITFEFVDGKEVAVQTLWWRLESWEKGKLLEPFPLTRYEVSLHFDDAEHPMGDVLQEVKS